MKGARGGACERARVYHDAPRFSALSEDKRQRERPETPEQGRDQAGTRQEPGRNQAGKEACHRKTASSAATAASASASMAMDPTFLPRSFWAGDSKFLQHPADLCTAVVVTRSVPAGACFGPCALQNTFYDTIAFIAQKSCDRRTKCYVFRVDPEAMRNSALVLSWLRLVQAARSREEQNMEAFLKAGQLYVRTTRDIRQDEELLVWYDQELSNLLGFRDVTRGPREDLNCGKCNQVFNNEYPFVAHCRFLCVQGKADPCSRQVSEHKHAESKRQHRVTDFHNLARDLEHKMSGSSEDAAELSPKRRRYEESPSCRGRKTVLLEKTNISNDDNITQLSRGCSQGAGDPPLPSEKLKADKTKVDHLGCRNDVVGDRKEARCADVRAERGESSGVPSGSSSAFSPVLSSEQKSAFCKPSKRTCPGNPQAQLGGPTAPASRPEDLPDAFSSRTLLGYNDLMASAVASGDVPAPAVLSNAFHYAPEPWHRTPGTPLPPTASLTILPPTFTSFGVSVQNWCAKCNLSFRMTSDLVFHMRSHHKKEFAAESQVRKRREEKLTCPICHEYFRERHHLSRHMTSHN